VEKDLGGGVKERYVYSGLETIAVYDALTNWKKDFVFGQGIDHVVMLQQPDVLDYDNDNDTSEIVRSYYHRNALGSVMAITDPAQATVASYRYDPYGKVTITRGSQTVPTDPLGQPWMYTARFFDPESGLYYYRARMYDPARGRFLQRDGMAYGQGPGLYEYAQSSPMKHSDPYGHGETGTTGFGKPAVVNPPPPIPYTDPNDHYLGMENHGLAKRWNVNGQKSIWGSRPYTSAVKPGSGRFFPLWPGAGPSGRASRQ